MSTKTETTSTNVYDPSSMAWFQKFLRAGGKNLMQYMKDPFESTFFNQRQQMAQQQIGGLAQQGQHNLMQNILAGGFTGNMPAFQQAELGRMGRLTSALGSNAFLQNLMESEQARRWATSGALQYQPLQTGQKGTQKVGGLGTWLPQLISIMMGASSAAFGGSGGGGINPSSFGMGSSGGFFQPGTLYGFPAPQAPQNPWFLGGS